MALPGRLQLPALSQAGFRPLAPDAPGFGGSPYDGRGWNIRRVAGQMAGLLEELGTGPAHVVGLSMGGVIAQQFALDFPQLTRKLVLVSTFSVLRPETLDGWGYFAHRSAAVLLLGMEAQAQVVARRVFPDPQDQALREMYIAVVGRADPRAYRRAMLSLGLFDSRKRLGQIKTPTLVLTGADDSTVSPRPPEIAGGRHPRRSPGAHPACRSCRQCRPAGAVQPGANGISEGINYGQPSGCS